MLKNYGVLKAQVQTDNGEFTSHKTGMSHYNLITILTDQEEYQVNIDVQSAPSANVRMYYIDNYINPLASQFESIANGFTPLSLSTLPLSLDYLRETLFDVSKLANSQPLSADAISQVLDKYLEDHEFVIVFGTMYNDDSDTVNTYGRTRYHNNKSLPPQGVHNVHMNQGSTGKQAGDNGTYQDGALFVKMANGSYSAFFFAFEEQCFHTDNNGNCSN